MKTAKIAHCPFCRNFIRRVYISGDRSFAYLKCKCGARGPAYHEKIKDFNIDNEDLAKKAIDLWNSAREQDAPIVDFTIWIDWD